MSDLRRQGVDPRKPSKLDRLIFLPVFAGLIGIWSTLYVLSERDRKDTLDLARAKLETGIEAIADAEEVLDRSSVASEIQKDAIRSSAFRHVLQLYPTARIWIESEGTIIAGAAATDDPKSLIAVEDDREQFTVRATVPKSDAIASAHKYTPWRVGIIVFLTVFILAVTTYLSRLLRQRAIAEADLLKSDAILRAVTRAATELLTARNYETTINDVLASVGQNLGVDRVQLVPYEDAFGDKQEIAVRQEWYAPHLAPLKDQGAIKKSDRSLSSFYTPEQITQILKGEPIFTYAADFPEPTKSLFIKWGIQSNIVLPVMIDGKPYGSLSFSDASAKKHRWKPIEIDTLKILTGLITSTLLRARYSTERDAAELDLRKRDDILNAITDAATSLLDARDYETTINSVLASVGIALDVDRILLLPYEEGDSDNRQFSVSQEWHMPHLVSLRALNTINRSSRNFKSFYTPEQAARLLRGEPVSTYADEFPEPVKSRLANMGVQSNLVVPIVIAGENYGSLSFSDASESKRQWKTAEIDTLKTLAGLIAAAVTRARQSAQRAAVEADLHKRDAILSAITGAATSLLSAGDQAVSIIPMLAAIGPAVGVHRVLLRPFIEVDGESTRMSALHEWHAPEYPPLATGSSAEFRLSDFYSAPDIRKMLSGEPVFTHAYKYPEAVKAQMLKLGTVSNLIFTIFADGLPYGNLTFNDAINENRQWTATEIDSLKIVAGLIGASVARTRQSAQRAAAEADLRKRDAILSAITGAAASLLSARDHAVAITPMLASVGPAVGVHRVILMPFININGDQIRMSTLYEWHAAGYAPVVTSPPGEFRLNDFYSTEHIAKMMSGEPVYTYANAYPEEIKAQMFRSGTVSNLVFTVFVDGNPYGNLTFNDAVNENRQWSRAEIDTLKIVAGLIGAAVTRTRDATEREQAMTRLLVRDRALESINQGVTIANLKASGSPIVYANPAFAALTKYSVDEIIGRGLLSFLDPEVALRVRDRLGKAYKEGRPMRAETPFKRKDSTFFLDSISISVIRDQNGEDLYGVAVHDDVTELRQREELLLEAQRMESVGQLTGGIAHDFNNLLTAIKSNAEDLRDDLKDNPLLQSQAEIVLEAADRGAGLVAQLMAFARKQELAPAVVDVGVLLDGIMKLLRSSLPAHITINLQKAESLPAIYVDPGRLENAIMNIALNARDAMPEGGTLTIEASVRNLDPDYVAEHIEIEQGEYVLIALTDTGTGMPPEVLERAFVPFFTTKEVGKGTGLGLSMVYGFVKQSGGHATIYSEQGLGTVVRIYLPILDQAPVSATPTANNNDAANPKAANILVVEDDPIVRQTIGNKLKRMGFTVTTADNALEAIEILKSTPHIDLVFSDVIMPGPMNGADLVREVRRRWPEINVLLTSGYTESTVLGKVKMPEDVKLLSKPYSNAELSAAISDLIG